MFQIIEGDVWFVNFPLEEDDLQFIARPVIVLDVESLEVLSVKVTKSNPRYYDDFDIPIVYWQDAHLRYKSTARVSKTIYINKVQFDFKIGTLHVDDFERIKNEYIRYVGLIT